MYGHVGLAIHASIMSSRYISASRISVGIEMNDTCTKIDCCKRIRNQNFGRLFREHASRRSSSDSGADLLARAAGAFDGEAQHQQTVSVT